MISVIGIGPSRENMTFRAEKAIKAADVIITYKSYIKNIFKFFLNVFCIFKLFKKKLINNSSSRSVSV